VQYTGKVEQLKNGAASVTVAASQTASVLADPFDISGYDAEFLILDVTISAITVTNAISVILQDTLDGVYWENRLTITPTATGTAPMFHQFDSNGGTLRPRCRLVATTGDTLTVTEVRRTKRG
jgi:hypothetical protein